MGKSIRQYHDSKSNLMAIVIPADYSSSGTTFVTSNEAFQQIGYMHHPEGHCIVPHIHNSIERTIDYTCETLIIRKGILHVDLYEEKKEIHSFDISDGDIISIFSGGHGFMVVEDVEMVEIKQGPYLGDKDKVRF